jgi:hypothetical protein
MGLPVHIKQERSDNCISRSSFQALTRESDGSSVLEIRDGTAMVYLPPDGAASSTPLIAP